VFTIYVGSTYIQNQAIGVSPKPNFGKGILATDTWSVTLVSYCRRECIQGNGRKKLVLGKCGQSNDWTGFPELERREEYIRDICEKLTSRASIGGANIEQRNETGP